jgi:heme oxygenase
MNLKELTWENHKKAERREFASILMSGKIEPELYYRYLTNQFYMYNILEAGLRTCGLPTSYWGVFRASRIRLDMQELEEQYGFVFDPATISRTTAEYATHIENLQKAEDLDALTAHMYVRHFGDMYGGAMISKKVPGAGLMYEFEDKENLKASLRELLIDDMAPEANICFEYAIRLFEELV